MRIRPVVLAVIAVLVLAPLAPSSLPMSHAAAMLTVPRNFATIQSAIDAARPGDTIRILPGTYKEQIRITKDLTIVGAGAESTWIAAPAALSPRQVNPRPGRAVIVEIYNGADVHMARLTVAGPSGTSCFTVSPPTGLAAFSVQQQATLALDSAAITGCTREGMLVGFSSAIPGGPGVGHAIVTKTTLTDYQGVGIQAGGAGTTLTLAHSTLVGAEDSAFIGQVGVDVEEGTAAITHNSIRGNLCHDPDCGPDFFNQAQASAIVVIEAGAGSVISHNEVSDNDTGIAVVGATGCCDISDNRLEDNRFFGMVLVDANHTELARHDLGQPCRRRGGGSGRRYRRHAPARQRS